MDIDSINEHSPWWARIVAILFGFIVLGSIANVFYLEFFGIAGINHYSFGNEPENPGDYPQNASAGEQSDYNWSLQEWEEFLWYQSMLEDLEESHLKETAQVSAALSVIIGIPAIAMFWTQNEKMLHFGIAFGTVKVVGDVLTAYISSGIIANYMDNIAGGADYSWIAKTSTFSSACCGTLFIGIAVVLYNMYHTAKEVPESGFHLKVNLSTEGEEIHGTDNDI